MDTKKETSTAQWVVCTHCFNTRLIAGDKLPEKCNLCGAEKPNKFSVKNLSDEKREEFMKGHLGWLKDEIIKALRRDLKINKVKGGLFAGGVVVVAIAAVIFGMFK